SATPGLCFQQFTASFPKLPGVGYPERIYGTPGVGVSPSSVPLCLPARHVVLLTPSEPSAPTQLPFCKQTAPVTVFRINTCKSVSKQRTLTRFRINTCEKPGGRGVGRFFSPLAYPDLRGGHSDELIPTVPAGGNTACPS